MSYTNLGINESLNTEYAKYKHKRISASIWDTAWSFNLIINLVISLLFIIICSAANHLFSEYKFNEYSITLILICFIINIGRIYITYYKLLGKLIKLNIQQILPNITIFILAIVLKYKISISIIILALFITNLISLIIFEINLPNRPKFIINLKIAKTLITRGISLLLYNFSFNFLILLASSIISIEYTVVEFGCFSFSNSIANGVIMAGGAFLFIFYPKILNSMNRPNKECALIIHRIKAIYVVGIDILTVLSIPAVLGISTFYPQYSLSMVRIYSILMIGKCINNATTGYSAYLISNKKEILMTIYALLSAGIEWCIIKVFLYYHLSMDYISLAIVLGSLFYTLLVVMTGVKHLYNRFDYKQIFDEILGNGNWMVLTILIAYSFLWTNIIFLICSLLSYYLLYIKTINEAIKNGISIIQNKNSLFF